MRLRFLGTGASGGTPGQGRSRRRESSVTVESEGTTLLLDATRDVEEQVAEPDALDGLLLTHGHRDASGGVPGLRRLRGPDAPPLPTLAAAGTFAVLDQRYRRLDHLDRVEVVPDDTHHVGVFAVTALQVPHARDERFPTYAWRLGDGSATVVYASDVASTTADLARFSAGADLLVIDGAMYGRSLGSHLRIDRDLPTVCGWEVDRVLLTQIGRSAPPHDELADVVRHLCRRAAPAFDGLQVDLTA